ncbi:phosphoribosylpyrophosphate synthetase [Aequorivita marisscotiae]|uniref:Phosphoribosylpyrophosphate synthetase n=1 Tax=Aequorivita marisscotiae TaxID=3040348 RepID=A0ABY8KUQ4_9FLAO|nr:phosphoribosylpyrophosphate synthetase [Aequorivita sp. Ant34-E75]WGF92693.1 phosphoribosylpyrophosphate synthetase [Aequorivita sp. Ant34-E75]
MKNSYSSLSVAIEDLQKNGFTEDFNLVGEGIESKNLKREWKAGELDVIKFYRFEGMTDPGDNTILYLIETHDGQRGLLVDVYGADQGEISPELIKKLSLHHDE